MATITTSIPVSAPAAHVWDALRDVGQTHIRVVPGVLLDCRLDGDSRVVTFASGAIVRERLVSVDDATMRVCYAVVESPFPLTHHSASMQVVEDGATCTVVWTTDVLPDDLTGPIGALVEAGAASMRTALAVTDSAR